MTANRENQGRLRLAHDLADPIAVMTVGVSFARQELGELMAELRSGPADPRTTELLEKLDEVERALRDSAEGAKLLRSKLAQLRPPSQRLAKPISAAPRTGRGRILIIDDQPLVATAVQRALDSDHESTALTDAREALELIRRGSRYDLILCDLLMPGMGGIEFYQALLELAPDQARRTALISGGAFTIQAVRSLAAVPAAQLNKPFEPEALRARVRALLSGLGGNSPQ
jgi:CheY-like chemotaxis protein